MCVNKQVKVVFDKKLLDESLEAKLEKKLAPIYNFIYFAEPSIRSLLEESQTSFEQKLSYRIKRLENLHPNSSHAN